MFDGITLNPGEGLGRALVLDESLSLWGAVDRSTGEIRDRTHPQYGQSIAGRVVVMASGRGSSSTASVLAEMIRAGVGPAAIVLGQPDGILMIGAIVAAELYGITMPVVVVPIEAFPEAVADAIVHVTATDDAAGIRITSAPTSGR